MRSTGLKLTLGGLFVCAALATSAMAAPDVFDAKLAPRGGSEERGSTIPSVEKELGFSVPGLINKVDVKNGDIIKKGQVLATLDTEVEEAALAKEQYLLASNVQLEAAKAQRDLAKVNFAREEKLFNDKAGSQLQYDQAKLELTVADLKIKLAEEETESKRLEIVRLRKQIDRMRIVSEFDGEVRKVEAASGEVADPQKPSIMVVSNNPLWVATKVPTATANTMKAGQALQVRYDGEKDWREAKVIFFDPVADATVGQQLIHLELPNPEGRRAGQEVIVKLPDNLAAAK